MKLGIKTAVVFGNSKYEEEMYELSKGLSSSGHMVYMPIMLDQIIGDKFPFKDTPENKEKRLYVEEFLKISATVDYMYCYNPNGEYPRYYAESFTLALLDNIIVENDPDINPDGKMDFMVTPDFTKPLKVTHPDYEEALQIIVTEKDKELIK